MEKQKRLKETVEKSRRRRGNLEVDCQESNSDNGSSRKEKTQLQIKPPKIFSSERF